jgi:hypothetical protein
MTYDEFRTQSTVVFSYLTFFPKKAHDQCFPMFILMGVLYNFLSSTLIQATHRHDLHKPKQRLHWLKQEEPIVIEYMYM